MLSFAPSPFPRGSVQFQACICSSLHRWNEHCAQVSHLHHEIDTFCLQSLHHSYITWITPGPTSLLLGTLFDLCRSKSELVAENALLRVPLIILRRQVKRPACIRTDRMLMVLLARMGRTWKQALFFGRTLLASKQNLFMSSLFSPKKQQSKRFLKRSDPLFSEDRSWSQYERVVPS